MINLGDEIDYDFDGSLIRCALTREQVLEMGLPAAPTKKTDSRAAGWSGIGQVELDAVRPDKLIKMTLEAVESVYDRDAHKTWLKTVRDERRQYKAAMVEYVKSGQFETDIE